MKKLFALIAVAIAISSPLTAHADVIDAEDARVIASDFLSQHQGGHRLNASHVDLTLSHTRFSSSQQTLPVYYVFADEAHGGWVMVAADDRAQTVLGYSEQGQFDADEMPCNMRSWLDGYSKQIEYLQAHPALKRDARAPQRDSSLDAIAPLLSTKWGQGKPFNNQCPKVNYYYSTLSGCVATAMAQVMNYHRYPQSECRGIPAYTSKRGISLPALSPVTFDWSKMANEYSYSYTTDQANAVAQLMRYCGQSVEMDYGTSVSNASVPAIPFALNYYFGFSQTAMFIMNDSTNQADWEQMMYDDLASGLPIIYSGNDASHGSHAFVLDGYRDGMFHINWGWSGDQDTYWLLSALTPNSYNFSTRHYAVLGVQPDVSDVNSDGHVDIDDVTTLIGMVLNNSNHANGRSGDVNGDSHIDVDDITALISMVLYGSGNLEPEGESFTVNGVTFRMVKVEGGTFAMGATDEQADGARTNEFPVHQVTLSSYYIGKTEVTQGLWQAVMGTNPSAVHGFELPVGAVNWNDCVTFIERLNSLTGQSFRLPTEAEWEFAARGGNNSRGYLYAGGNVIDNVAWYYDNARYSYGRRVATKQPNELGIYDMCGNNYEWCADYYGDYSADAQTDPQGPDTGSYRVVRSGSWYTTAAECRIATRDAGAPDEVGVHIGFRLAL